MPDIKKSYQPYSVLLKIGYFRARKKMTAERRWLSVREAAGYLSIHAQTCYAWAARGILPAIKIGGSLRIDRQKLDEKLERQLSQQRVRR